MANKYANLVGTNKIKDEYTKINTGFDGVEADINKLETDVTAVNTRVDTIITTPISGEAATQEIVDARVSAVKSKTFASLDARFEETEQDIATLDARFEETEQDIASHMAEYTAHGEIANVYRSGKDANGVFVTLEYKRTDGTLFKKSVLSGGTSPKYTTRTVTYYDTNGTTVLVTKVYTLTYTGDDLTSEVTS